MKRITTLITLTLIVFSTPAIAGEIIGDLEEGCKADIEKYCNQVMPGEGRMLACFYAHEDKISGQCQYAMYDAAARLEQAVTAFNYVASQCNEDIIELCADVQVGEGRILQCLDTHADNVSEACKQAVADVFE